MLILGLKYPKEREKKPSLDYYRKKLKTHQVWTSIPQAYNYYVNAKLDVRQVTLVSSLV